MKQIHLCGPDSPMRVWARLSAMVRASRPPALGMASAFLSLPGAKRYHQLSQLARSRESRVVAGLSGHITHPAALRFLAARGHRVRSATMPGAIFHPKLLAGGARFDATGLLATPALGYMGSANFTASGLLRNREIILTTREPVVAQQVAEAFQGIWDEAQRMTERTLHDYERGFARAQRARAVSDLSFLDVADAAPATGRAAAIGLVPPSLCRAVWAGLESFTGEHAFQVEFPRDAGEALAALLGAPSGVANIRCSDGRVRRMQYRYYEDNSMYRLNVPNDVPQVDWARASHAGALLVWREDGATRAALQAEIVRGPRMRDVAARSRALGTCGRTSTRQYGWY